MSAEIDPLLALTEQKLILADAARRLRDADIFLATEKERLASAIVEFDAWVAARLEEIQRSNDDVESGK